MSKQSIKKIVLTIVYISIVFIMFGLFKNLFGQPDNNRLAQAIQEGAYLVDVRTPGEFASGSVRGAVNIPLDQIQAQIDKFKDKKTIVVFCRSGGRSSQAKSILERNGFDNVINGGTWENVASVKQICRSQ
ncbi:sulfurtransferase [Porphyromonas crevioricanis]|uniref:Sulfurtransferase n=1 Tax=Porphyromonas crevioricanis TaxID=393921 RepID=A0A0A2FQU4_9PORP|nr:rhodanese-like domain-containing protein [Porphyromonas crevioricanis]KGN91024.1 sulfurtransferase [Porphyromonas crevioricanis]KGN93501.1 sulfurtransferase [Porphyromonas crevioricanis]SQH73372.1 Thiosulfate sulfurtransferase PspE precursor [Porphyromonas crevioricanis]